MTTLAPPPPHLARLFNRLDAADASDPLLRIELEFWRNKRGSRLMPTADDLAPEPDLIAAHIFVFKRSNGTNEWEASRAGSEAAALLGLASQDKRLSKLLAPRIAARLRRLFETVAETAEPLAAAFELRVKPDRRLWIEILAAPLSSDGRHVDGVYGGITSRLEAAAPAAR
ncbi:PAS domain-containing protein [Methylocapsa polymorpha]|uniref:PAS domain-containing protein n=1 Tax=Methylocapsa polymorpha TaxID=3080828 RepID=A0ABZ0HT45_9HYPH|nr:PAS domain-containing protein [Methylocapsa sp. RX1]